MVIKNIIVLNMLFLMFSVSGFAQATTSLSDGVIMLYKNSADNEKSTNRGAYGGDHLLGDEITEWFNKFEKAFTYYKDGSGAYASKVKVIEKKPIYKAVHRVNKYLEKGVRMGRVPTVEAKNRLAMVFEKAILLAGAANTEQIEDELSGLKKPEAILEYFGRFEIVEGNKK